MVFFCDRMAMKLIGRVASIHDKKLIVKSPVSLDKGKKVYDDGEEFVGEVVEYFGPTDTPYLVIATKKDPERYLGEKVYY